MDEFILAVTFIAVIVLMIVVINLSSKVKKYQNEMKTVRDQLRDLYSKSFYLYDLVNTGPENDKQDAAEPQKPAAGVDLAKNPPQPARQDTPAEKPFAAAVTDISPAAGAAAVSEAPSQPVQIHTPYAAPQPVSAQTSYQPAPKPAPVYSAPAQNAPVRPAPVRPAPVRPAPAVRKRHFEEWLGTRLFNIAASLLIFIGLILFCTLSTEQVTNTMKMIAMFIVSGGFIAVGAFLARKDKSVFPLGMLGCGFGTFFITILLSHIYFHSLEDIPAFALILVWSAFALFMSRKLNSIMLSVTAHIGTAVSICFAFTLGFTAERVIFLTVYQLAAIAVIIAGNIFCCRKTYRFGLIMSQCLLVYTSVAMSSAFSEKFIMPQSISVTAAIVIYAIQFIAISFVSYLVSTSAAALEGEGLKLLSGKFADKAEAFDARSQSSKMTAAATAIHLVNKVLWTSGTIASVGCITYYICRNAFHTNVVLPTASALVIAALLHLFLTLILEQKLSFSAHLSIISVWFISVMTSVSLFAAAHNTGLPFVFVYALLLAGLFKLTKLKGVAPVSAAVLFFEAVYMTFYGFFKIENVWISIPYMVGIGAVLLLLWFIQSGESKQRTFKYMKIAEYLWLSVSIISINASEFSSISFPLIMSEFALMNIICYFIKFGGENEPDLRTVVKAESLLTVYVGIFALSVPILGDNNIIKAVFVVMTALITAVYVYDFAKSKNLALKAAAAFTVAVFTTSLSFGFSDYFKPFYIYAVTLNCTPFFFVFTAALLAIYLLTKDSRLSPFIWATMVLDMLCMGLAGYGKLVLYTVTQDGHDLPLHMIMTGISLAHASLMLGLSFLMGSLDENSSVMPDSVKNLSKYVSYFWINLAYPSIAFWAFARTSISSYRWAAAMILLTAVNTAVYALKYHGKKGTAFNIAVRITSAAAFYIALPTLSQTASTAGEYTATILLMLSCVALFFVKARESLRENPGIWVQVFVGISATFLVNCACNGLSSTYDFSYIFSVITMITALICIIIGFASKAKGLRVYGLIVVMICIIKLVTADISGADSLARVVAFVVGGIVCFIISGIYNALEKKLKDDSTPVMQQIPVMQTVSANGAPINAVTAPIADPAPAAGNAPVESAPQAAPEKGSSSTN